MNADYRHPDPAIAAWLAEGPLTATAESRRAIAAAVRGTGQRGSIGSIDLARQAKLLAAAALLVAVAAFAVSAGRMWLVPPVVTPTPTELAPSPTVAASPSPRTDASPTFRPDRGTATLVRLDREITFTYAIPDGLEVDRRVGDDVGGMVAFSSLPGGGPFDPDASPEPGAHGITVANVTHTTNHGSLVEQPIFGATAADFLIGLDASRYFVVEDVAQTSIGPLPAWSARVSTEGDWWTHIDFMDEASRRGSVDFNSPCVVYVTDVGDAIVLVHVWADTPENLADWLPRARPFIDSLEFEAPVVV